MNLKILVIVTFVIPLGLTGQPTVNRENNRVISKSIASPVQPNSRNLPSAKLQILLNNTVSEQKIPGAVMYISTPKGKWLSASGVSNLETQTPMKATDGFAIASMSKTFVAVVVLKLAQEGKLNLDQAIANYLPKDISSHIANSQKITVRQLLNHTSGVAEYLDTKEFKNATAHRSRLQPWTATEAIHYIDNALPQAAPAQKFIYTDSNYILLELIVEKTSRGTLAQAIRNRILHPLGLKNTFTELREPTLGHLATGYGDRHHNGLLESFADVNDGNGLGDGGLVSNAEDLAEFAKALFAKKTLLSPQMEKAMLTFTKKEGYGYGLGVERFSTPFGKSFGHSGVAYGFITLMAYIPGKDTTIIVLFNTQSSNLQVIKAIANLALEIC